MASISRAARRGTAVLAAAAVSGFAAMPAAGAVTSPVIVPAADQPITSSTLEWGVRESFRNYIQGPIAQGEWTVSGASADSEGIVTWQGGAGEFDPETGVGSASFSGGVHYTGHWDHFEEGEPALSVEIENPTVEIEGTTGTLYADVESQSLDQQIIGGTQVALVELSLPDGVQAEEDHVSAVATTVLTAEGADAFAGFYESGEQLDPLSFSFALAPAAEEEEDQPEAVEEPQEADDPAEEAPSGEEAAEEPVAEEEAETPAPGSSGSGNSQNSSNSSNASNNSNSSGNSGGSSNSSTSSNSGSNASGSSPASGNSSSATSSSNNSGSSNTSGSSSSVSPSGGSGSSAPAPTAASAESSVLNSSVLPEQEEAVTTETVCTGGGVSGATLNWGLRESFRSYIQGGIAQGDWTLNGTSYSGGQYIWSGGAGNFDPDAGTGTVGFSGGVHFTGHDGVLDLNISNPAIQVTGPNSAVLIADVVSSTMDGDRIDLTGVTFASISGAIDVGGDTASASGASATLTAAGAEAFAGFYESREALDPISFTFPLTEECHEVTLGADGQPIAGGPGGAPLAQTGATVGDVALGSAALLAVGLTLMVLKRRRHSETVTITAA